MIKVLAKGVGITKLVREDSNKVVAVRGVEFIDITPSDRDSIRKYIIDTYFG